MKKIIIIILILIGGGNLFAQVSTKVYEKGKAFEKHPWWILITSRDNNQKGYNFLKSVFNGFSELEKQDDAGKELLMEYMQINPEKRIELKTLVEKGNYSFQIIYIETILSQPNILEKLTKQNLVQLLDVAISVFRDKSNPSINYSLLSLSSTGLLLGRILEINKTKKLSEVKEEFIKCEEFINGGITDDRKMLIRIYSEAEEYSKNLQL